ncbi:MAG: hypothetical protein K2J13_02265, partial [Clostridia bacterium]|nr:hypothetical protein [Clostridia bacterium]
MSFTAPENGIYTFETFGAVKNEFTAKSGEINNTDNFNQKLIIMLRKGQEFYFSSKNISGSNGIYQIKAEFTPTEIRLDGTQTLKIKSGESEFLTYNSAGKIGVNYSLNTNGDYTVSILSGDRSNVIDTASMESKKTNAIVLNSAGKYLIKVTNSGETDAEIKFSLTSIAQMNIGQAYDLEIGHKALYKFASKENCIIGFEWKTINDVKVSLLDEDYNILVDKDDFTMSFKLMLEKNKVYYLLFENDTYYYEQAQFEMSYSPQNLIFGNNIINKDEQSMTYGFTLSTDAQIRLEATNGISLSFYDIEWNAIAPKDGLYSTIGGNKYLIVANGAASAFELIITLDYTENLSGNIGEEGYRFISFSPEKTDIYEVSGIDTFEWYEPMLRPFGNMLYAGDTYYLKIYGESNSEYDITISRKVTPIELRNRINLKSGVYSIEIENSGMYTVNTAISNGVTAIYSITNSLNEVVCSEISAGGKYPLHFAAGIYFIEIETNEDVELLVNFLNADDTSLNNKLYLGENHSVIFKDNTDNTFEFVATTTAEHYLSISYSGARLTVEITITNEDNELIDFDELDIKQDIQGKRYV